MVDIFEIGRDGGEVRLARISFATCSKGRAGHCVVVPVVELLFLLLPAEALVVGTSGELLEDKL